MLIRWAIGLLKRRHWNTLGFGLPEATRSRRDLAQPHLEGGRIDQTCFARRGGLAPINFPLFQGSRPALGGMTSMKSRIVMLLYCRGTSGCASWLIKLNLKVSFQERCGRGRPSVGISSSQADPIRHSGPGANADLMAKVPSDRPTHRVFVAFAGGGAKGLIHVGALKALEDWQVQFCGLAGTSAGAIVASLKAAGFEASDLLDPESDASLIDRLREIDQGIVKATVSAR